MSFFGPELQIWFEGSSGTGNTSITTINDSYDFFYVSNDTGIGITIEKNKITYFDTGGGWIDRPFIGFKIESVNCDILPIVGFSIDENNINYDTNGITFTETSLSINLSGLEVISGVNFSFYVTFGTAVPEPNNAPAFTGSALFTVDENETTAGRVRATDADGNTVTYSIVGGADAGLFAINARTGVLTFNDGAVFNDDSSNSYEVRISASDGIDVTTQLFTVDVRGVREGTAGDDVFNAVNGSGRYVGGDGFDTVIFSGVRADFDIGTNDDGVVIVTAGPDVHELHSIERIEFSDGALVYDLDDMSSQIFRLYQSAFNRTPDLEGLDYWIDRLSSGDTTLNAIADSFLQSPEFVQTYGTEQTVGNSHFVALLYLNTLGRSPDSSGFSYWMDKLDSGETNRNDLFEFFSESNENVARTDAIISDGVWIA